MPDKELPTKISKRFSKKQRRKQKFRERWGKTKSDQIEDSVQRDFKLAEGEVSLEERETYQKEILRNIIVCYVRLLKTDPQSTLLFSALAGLSQYVTF